MFVALAVMVWLWRLSVSAAHGGKQSLTSLLSDFPFRLLSDFCIISLTARREPYLGCLNASPGKASTRRRHLSWPGGCQTSNTLLPRTTSTQFGSCKQCANNSLLTRKASPSNKIPTVLSSLLIFVSQSRCFPPSLSATDVPYL